VLIKRDDVSVRIQSTYETWMKFEQIHQQELALQAVVSDLLKAESSHPDSPSQVAGMGLQSDSDTIFSDGFYNCLTGRFVNAGVVTLYAHRLHPFAESAYLLTTPETKPVPFYEHEFPETYGSNSSNQSERHFQNS
jgi:hypothetical protein